MKAVFKDAKRIVTGTLSVLTFCLVWEGVVRFGVVPDFLLPAPTEVVLALVADGPLIFSHALVTLAEAVLGLGIGVLIGFVLAILMDRFEYVAYALNPFIIFSQTVPTVAIAPLLVLWFGYNLTPKVILVVVTTFFPVAVSLLGGFRSVDPDLLALMQTMRATPWQTFWKVKIPAAAAEFFSGLRISASYAVVSAVVAEWLGGFMGLGVFMTRVRKSFAYDRMFAAIIVISLCSVALIALISVIERICMPWRRARTDGKDA